jgi:hypothetical protein
MLYLKFRMDLTRLKYQPELNSIIELGDSLKFKKLLKRSGKQGLLGLFKYTDKKGKKHPVIFKISLDMNYVIRHEYKIMNDLMKVSPYCHNFCHSISSGTIRIDSNYKQSVNPFSYKKDSIEVDIMTMEFLDEAKKFYFYIKNQLVPQEMIFSQIKQVLCATQIAQQECKFTHYDLHSNNVLIKECDPNTFFLYVLNEENQYLIPSYGYYPVIIDFGFSYSGACEKSPLHGALAHTDVGFMSSTFDELADPRLFLVSVSFEMDAYRKSHVSRDFKHLVRGMFKGLQIDWDCGWDKGDDIPASDYVSYMLEDDMNQSPFFAESGHYCVDLLQGLIDLPLRKRSYEDISENFNIFYKEFEIIEELFGSNFYLLYMFKRLIDFAQTYKHEYLNDQTREEATRKFKYDVYTEISKFIKFSNPKIHYERMLCSLIMLSKNVEGILYDAVHEKLEKRNKQKKHLPIKSILDIYPRLDYTFSDSYTLSSNSKIVVIDAIKKQQYEHILTPSQMNELNEMDEIFRGFFLYQNLI